MHVAEAFHCEGEREVIVAPPAAVLSQWIEAFCVRVALLEGRPVHASADPLTLQRVWGETAPRAMRIQPPAERHQAARRAREADRLMSHWWVGEEPAGLDRVFWGWRRRASDLLSERRLLGPEGWITRLAERLREPESLPCELPNALELDGFLEITALERSVLEALEERGVGVERSSEPSPAGVVAGVFAFASPEDEFHAAARWAREKRERGRSRIAVVINGLEGSSAQARAAFENVFQARERLAMEDLADSDFHVSRGEPLGEHRVVGDALLLLKIATAGLDTELDFPRLSRWLLSPYWGGALSERAARARLEYVLRGMGRYRHSPAGITRLVESRGAGQVLSLLLEHCRRGCEESRTDDWGERFALSLERWGWPGRLGAANDAALHATVFRGLLEGLSRLPLRGADDAMDSLHQAVAQSKLLLRGGALSPIQILSPEDAVGRRFDAVWIANVHDGNWPRAPLSNPYLPGALARRIPRGTPAGELGWCEALTRALKRVAPDVRFSWSRQTGHGVNGVSPLLADLEQFEPEPAPAPALVAEVAPAALELSGYEDHPWLGVRIERGGQPLQAGQPIPGGSGALRDQAACPLAAYLRHRLQARFDEMPTAFADAAYRGWLMHEALRALYERQVGQPGSPPGHLVADAVDGALQRCGAAQRLLPLSLVAERQRLESLLREWLDFEASRENFIVEGVERNQAGELGGHPIFVRADRIDRLPDGRALIIDYKSGTSPSTGWADDRPRDPQLPLYAVLAGSGDSGAIGGVALATVRPGGCGMSGVCDDPLAAFDRIDPFANRRLAHVRRFGNWRTLFSHWRDRMDALASEIAVGLAENVHYDDWALRWSGLEVLLRGEEGEAWLLAHDRVEKGSGRPES